MKRDSQWDHYEFTVADHYLSALINDDDSSLSADDLDALNAWLEKLNLPQPGHWATVDEESFFGRDEVTGLKSNVSTVRWMFRDTSKRRGNPSSLYAAAFQMIDGRTLYYTGKAGDAFLSADSDKGFFQYSEQGAADKALRLKFSSPMLAKARALVAHLDGENVKFKAAAPSPTVLAGLNSTQLNSIVRTLGQYRQWDDVDAIQRAAIARGDKMRASNPLVRVKVNSRSLATGKAPSARLKRRRARTAKAPAGFYANPVETIPVGIQVNAGSDINGNSRRGVLVVNLENGVFPKYVGFVKMTYQSASQSLTEAGYSGDMAIIGEFKITPAQFREFVKRGPRWMFT